MAEYPDVQRGSQVALQSLGSSGTGRLGAALWNTQRRHRSELSTTTRRSPFRAGRELPCRRHLAIRVSARGSALSQADAVESGCSAAQAGQLKFRSSHMASLSRQSTQLCNAYGTQLDACSRPLRTFPARASVSPLLTGPLRRPTPTCVSPSPRAPARAFCCSTRSIPLRGGPTCTVILQLQAHARPHVPGVCRCPHPVVALLSAHRYKTQWLASPKS